MPSTVIGDARETIVNDFLELVLPPIYRFSRVVITDAHGRTSRQVDVVVELPHNASFPMPAPRSDRLYLADTVAAVIEVKSDISKQWDQAGMLIDLTPSTRNTLGLEQFLERAAPPERVHVATRQVQLQDVLGFLLFGR